MHYNKAMKFKTKPWLTRVFLKCISVKNKLFKKCFSSSSSSSSSSSLFLLASKKTANN